MLFKRRSEIKTIQDLNLSFFNIHAPYLRDLIYEWSQNKMQLQIRVF